MRIVGELRKLGITVSATLVRNVLARAGIPPAPERAASSWRSFLRQHANTILACDLFTVDTVWLRRLYVLFFVSIGTRRVEYVACTSRPDTSWMSQQARNLLMDLDDRSQRPRFLIHDRDAKFSRAFDSIFRSEGIEIVRTPIQAPNANAHAERWVGSKFRRKVRAKLAAWDGPPLEKRLHVLSSPWARFTFADEQMRGELVELVRRLSIDVIVAGPRGVHKFGPPGRICQLAGRNRFSHRIAAETLIQPPAPGPSREISLSTWARKRVRLAKVERTPGRASSETTQPPDRDPRGKISRCFRRLLIGSGIELTHPTGRLGRATLIPRSTH